MVVDDPRVAVTTPSGAAVDPDPDETIDASLTSRESVTPVRREHQVWDSIDRRPFAGPRSPSSRGKRDQGRMMAGDGAEVTGRLGAIAMSHVFRARGTEGILAVLARVVPELAGPMIDQPDLWITYADLMAVVHAAADVCDEPDIGYRLGEELARVLSEMGRLASLPTRIFEEAIEVMVDILDGGSVIRRLTLVEVSSREAVIDAASFAHADDRFFCRLFSGFLTAVAPYVGRTGLATETQCVTKGAATCRFHVDWLAFDQMAGSLAGPFRGGAADEDLDERYGQPFEADHHDQAAMLKGAIDGLALPQNALGLQAILISEADGEITTHTRGNIEMPHSSRFTAEIVGVPGVRGTITMSFVGRILPSVDQLLVESCARTIAAAVQEAWNFSDLRRRATRDPLTGLANRRHLEDRAADLDEGDAVAFLDLNGFKAINDDHGHPAGDALLAQIGRRLQDAVRTGDLVARFGGDEFVVLIVGTRSAADVGVVAQKLLAVFDIPFDLNGEEVHLSASWGVARSPDDGDTLSSLVAAADQRMYASKIQRRRATERTAGSPSTAHDPAPITPVTPNATPR